MSNISLFTSGEVAIPDFLRNSDETTKLLAGGGGFGKQISIKGGVWRMIAGGEEVARNEERAMNFVIVNAAPKVSRTYFEGEYKEGGESTPACWSANGVAPNEEVPEESRQSSLCATCPKNIAGSGQGTSRACRYSRRLAVVLENDLSGNVYRLQLPAKSIFGKPENGKMPLDAYAKFLDGHGVPITGVVTEARFDTAEAVPVIKFRAVRPLSQVEWHQVQAAAASPDSLAAVEFKMVIKPKAAGAAAASPYAQPEPEPAKAPKKAKVEAPEEPIAEPVARAAKAPAAQPAATPAVSAKAQTVLDQWLDDDDS